MRFSYWKLKARAHFGMLMLDSKDIPYEWDDSEANNWKENKNKMPFQQLPVVYDDDLTIAQSGAITRYCARKANLIPTNEEGAVMCDMVICQADDIYTAMAKCKYPDRLQNGEEILSLEEAQNKAWTLFINERLSKYMGDLSRLLGNRQYFTNQVLRLLM